MSIDFFFLFCVLRRDKTNANGFIQEVVMAQLQSELFSDCIAKLCCSFFENKAEEIFL